MSDDLSRLPLKSMELPTKTVAKLKPLAVTTIGELYAVPVARFVELGLTLRELEEIAEAAPDFGCTWSSKAEVKAAFAASPAAAAAAPAEGKAKPAKTAKAPAADTKKKPAATAARGSLPADFEEALAAGPEAVGLTVADVDALEAYGSLADGFQTPAPSAKHLRVFRRLRLVRAPSIGGAERWYVVAVVDVTQIPRERRARLETILVHLGNLVVDVFQRAGAPSMSQASGGATTFAINAKTRAKAEKLIAAHRARFDAAPAFALPIENLEVIAAASLVSAELHDEALPLVPALASAARGLASNTSMHALRTIAEIFLAARRACSDGLAVLTPILTSDALASVPRGHDAASAIVEAAKLCALANAPALATAALARAVAVSPSDVQAPTLRAQLLDERTFDVLHRVPAFRALFRGFPAFEARLA